MEKYSVLGGNLLENFRKGLKESMTSLKKKKKKKEYFLLAQGSLECHIQNIKVHNT